MPPVTLHQPAEGLNRGDTYTGPREEWLVQNGYASAQKADHDGLHSTTVDAKNDPTLAANREDAPGADDPEGTHPRPEGDVELVDDGTARNLQAPEVDPVEYTPEGAKGAEAKRKGVEDGDRYADAPDVRLEQFREARRANTGDDAVRDEDIVKRQESAVETAPEVLADRRAAERDQEAGLSQARRAPDGTAARQQADDEEPKKATRRSSRKKDDDSEE